MRPSGGSNIITTAPQGAATHATALWQLFSHSNSLQGPHPYISSAGRGSCPQGSARWELCSLVLDSLIPMALGQPGHQGKPQNEGQPDDEAQPEDKGKQDKQGQSEDEGKPQGGEGKRESQAKPESERRAAEKRPAEDYVPRKAKRKTDRGTDDSPKDYQEDLQERHLGSEEMMRECGDMSRAQEELRKKQKMGGFHWMQRDVQDPFAPRGQRGVRGVRGGGRGQRGLHDIPYL
nr:PREDICTED: transcription elongation factor A protein-like 3 [Equus przewalskii]